MSLKSLSGTSRSSPIPTIGMTLSQAPQQQQTHQARDFNLGGYVLIRVKTSGLDARLVEKMNFVMVGKNCAHTVSLSL